MKAPVVAMLLFQIAALFARSFLQRVMLDAGYDQTAAKHSSYLVVPVIEYALFWPILRANKNQIYALCAIPASWPRLIGIGILLGLCARIGGWSLIVAATAFGWIDYVEIIAGASLQFTLACPAPLSLALAIVVLILLIPLVEEIVNRGLIFAALIHRSPLFAILMSAFFFAILHEASIIPAAFLIGILFAILTFRTRSLLPAIAAHMTFNAIRVVDSYCFSVIWHPATTNGALPLIGGVAGILALAAGTCAIWLAAGVRTEASIAPRS